MIPMGTLTGEKLSPWTAMISAIRSFSLTA
jgi:hypothetical protein